jgi:type I restriction enzyme S subunit
VSDLNIDLSITLGEAASEPVEQAEPTSDFVYVDISSIDRESKKIKSAKTLSINKAPGRARQVLRAGDVLVSMTRPNLNAVALVPDYLDGAIGSTGFHVLRSKWIKPEFLFGLVQTDDFISAMSKLVQGALYPAVRPKDVASFKFTLRSLKQQINIVGKLEEVLSDIDAGVSELKTAQKKLGRYRQSILTAGMEGTLTAEWRSQNMPTDTGMQLLQSITTKRRDLWEVGQLSKFKEQDKIPPKDWKNKYSEPLQPNIASLPQLPTGWRWVSIDCLLSDIETGNSFKCVERPPTVTEVGVVKVSSVSWGEYDEKESKTCILEERIDPKLFVKPGDFLFSRANTVELVGACVIAKNVTLNVMLSDKILRFILIEDSLKNWLLHFLRSKIGRRQIESLATGNQESMKNIGQNRIRSIGIPIGPKSEIDHAISLIEQGMASVTRQLSDNDSILKQSTAQRKQILRAAFAGQLVLPDLNDEPASALFERIHTERTEREKQPGTRRKKQQKEVAVIMSKLIDVLNEAGDWVSAQEAFRRCGVSDGAQTNQVEALYAELRELDKAGRLAVKPLTDAQGRKLHDQLKLVAT